jgi:hypothetical protein
VDGSGECSSKVNCDAIEKGDIKCDDTKLFVRKCMSLDRIACVQMDFQKI